MTPVENGCLSDRRLAALKAAAEPWGSHSGGSACLRPMVSETGCRASTDAGGGAAGGGGEPVHGQEGQDDEPNIDSGRHPQPVKICAATRLRTAAVIHGCGEKAIRRRNCGTPCSIV